MFEDIARSIRRAGATRQKIAMFHLQVLTNATMLGNVDPVAFCSDVGVPASFATEFRKMIGLAHLMESEGLVVRPR